MRYTRQVFFIIAMLLVFSTAVYSNIYRPQPASGSANIEEPIKLPILMYHQISEKPKKWGKYVVSPKELEHDIKLVLDRGFTPITVSELVAYVNGEGTLPKKPIMITFDDGNRSDYIYAFPLAKKYQIKMISSPVGAYSERYSNLDDHNVDYAHLTWAEMREMQDSGLFEFQNHSYNLHNFDVNRKGCLKKKNESESDYKKLILEDFKKSQQLFVDQKLTVPICFTYPFGSTNDMLLQYVKQNGFIATLGTYEHVNQLSGTTDELYDLGRFNRPHNFDIRRILNQAE